MRDKAKIGARRRDEDLAGWRGVRLCAGHTTLQIQGNSMKTAVRVGVVAVKVWCSRGPLGPGKEHTTKNQSFHSYGPWS